MAHKSEFSLTWEGMIVEDCEFVNFKRMQSLYLQAGLLLSTGISLLWKKIIQNNWTLGPNKFIKVLLSLKDCTCKNYFCRHKKHICQQKDQSTIFFLNNIHIVTQNDICLPCNNIYREKNVLFPTACMSKIKECIQSVR